MHFSFLNIRLWWLDLLLGSILFSLTYFAYKNLALPKKDKKFLIFIRSLTISLFLLAFLQPVFHYVFYKYTKPHLAVFLDRSASMSVKKKSLSYFKESQVFLNKNFKSLKKKFNLKIFTFSDNLSVNPNQTKATGYDSNLSQSLQTFFYNFSDDNYRGILLFSDGQFSSENNQDKMIRILKNNDIPVIPILADNNFYFSDVAIQFAHSNPVELKTEQKSAIAVNIKNTTPFKVFNIKIYDNNQLIQMKKILTKNKFYNFSFPYLPQKTGIHKLKIMIQAKDEFQKNNQDFLFIKVNKGKYNVGFIYGEVNWEYKFLKRTLSQDGNIKLFPVVKINKTIFLKEIAKFPLKQMDMLILGDVSQKDLSLPFQTAIADQVQSMGLSLFVLGGPNSFLSEKINNSSFANILPVIPNFKMGKITNPTAVKLTVIGKNDSLTQISDESIQNEKIWQNVPPFEIINWCVPKKNSSVLLTSVKNKKIPILIYKQAHKGKVVCFTGFPMWHWYFLNVPTHQSQNYTSFIRQLVRDLTSSRLERFNLYTDKFLYKMGEIVKVYAVLFDSHYHPLNQKTVKVQLYQKDKFIKTITLKNSLVMKERFESEWTPNEFGEYSLVLKTQSKIKKAFFVVGQNQKEFFNIGVNKSMLERIAKENNLPVITKNNLSLLKKKLSAKKIKQKFSIQKELWNSFIIILIIVGLLTIEWVYRKNKGLL